jgi:hypothetical protein
MPLSCSLPPVISCLILVHFLLSSHSFFFFTSSCHLMPLSCSLPPVISCLFLVHFLLSTHASFLFTSLCHLMPLSYSLPHVNSCLFCSHFLLSSYASVLLIGPFVNFPFSTFVDPFPIPNKIMLCNIQYLLCVSLCKNLPLTLNFSMAFTASSRYLKVLSS